MLFIVRILSVFLIMYSCSIAQNQDQSISKNDTLRLSEVLAIVNANHPKLLEAKLGITSAAAGVQRAWGSLDPRVSTELYAKQENESIKQQSATAELTIPLYWGPKISAGWKRRLGLFDEDLNTSLQGETSFGLSFPLWKNILIDKNRAMILKAEQLPVIADAEILEIRNALFLKASEKYWEWAGSYAKYTLAQNLLSIAENRLQGIVQEISAGERARIDSIEMAQEILRRKGSVIKARREFEKSGIALSVFLWNSDGTPALLPELVLPVINSSMRLISNDQFVNDKSKALIQRPEILKNKAELSMSEIDIQFANEQWKPDITMKVSPYTDIYTSSGSSQLDYRFALQAEIPLMFRDARGQTMLAEVKQQSLTFKQSLIQREIAASTDDALSELIASYQQAITAKEEVNAAKTMEDVERQLFANGEGSLFTVNFRERFTVESAAREIDALMNYHKAVAYYQWSIAGY